MADYTLTIVAGSSSVICPVRTYDPLFRRFSAISPCHRTYVPLFAVKRPESPLFSPNKHSSVRWLD